MQRKTNMYHNLMEKNLDILVQELCKLPKEIGWVEFKQNLTCLQLAEMFFGNAYLFVKH